MGQTALFDREFCEPLALLAAGSICAAGGGAAAAGFALFGAPAIALGAWSAGKWINRLKNKSPDNAQAVAKIQGALIEKLRGDGTLEMIKPELRARLDTELPTLIAAHWPSPQRIAKLSGTQDGFPSAIGTYVLDEIDGSTFADDLYEATSVRRFVCMVVETALDAALADKDFFTALEPHVAIETLNLTGQIKRDMDGFVSDLDEVKDILSEAVPAILESLEALHGKFDRMDSKLDLLVAKVVGSAQPSPEEVRQTEQSVADLLASNMRASQDAADILLSDGSAAATSRLKQSLAEQNDARVEATKNEIALLKQIAAINFYDDGHEAVLAFEKIVILNPDDIDTWNRMGLLRFRLGDLGGAQQAFQRVADLAGSRKDYASIALGNMGLVAKTRGDLDAAMRYYERSLQIETQLGREDGMASDYGNMGIVAQTRGDLDVAMDYYERALELNKALGRTDAMACDYGDMGNVAQMQGNAEGAMLFYERALELNKSVGRKEGMAIQYANMGNVAHMRGDLDGAMRYYEQSLELSRELGAKDSMSGLYGNMGNVAQARGDLDEAMNYYERSLELSVELGGKEGMSVVYGSMGNVAKARGDLDGAMGYYERALELNKAVGRKQGMAFQYGNMGNVAEARGDLDGARSLWDKSLALFTEIGATREVSTVKGWLEKLGD